MWSLVGMAIMAMTPAEFGAVMRHISEECGGDIEGAHAMADEAMCKLLIDLGFDDGVKIFDEMDKWYA